VLQGVDPAVEGDDVDVGCTVVVVSHTVPDKQNSIIHKESCHFMS
jgi:hypothetical protein